MPLEKAARGMETGGNAMPLNLIYITNDPAVARIAEINGVQRIMVDLETLGKETRQGNMNTVKSHHTVADVKRIAKELTSAKLLVRINPWYAGSQEEIKAVLAAGADSIMLPMWRHPEEVDAFLKAVNRNAETTLLLETKEAVECLDTVLKHPLLDNIHIGLNDLHLSYGMTFLFEPFVNGVVESVCRKCAEKGIPCGVGGIARLGNGLVPAEHIITEHYRLGSSAAILSRAFCDTEKVGDISSVSEIFQVELQRIRDFEGSLSAMTEAEYEQNRQILVAAVQNAVAVIRSRRMAEQT
jgi:2-keto-3-deoxy-L-rhamnonate aldolase RhmA